MPCTRRCATSASRPWPTSAAYYSRVIKVMFLGGAEGQERVPTSSTIGFSMGAAALGVLVFSVIPSPLLTVAEHAVSIFKVQ